MRVLHVCRTYPPSIGGQQGLIAALSEGLVRDFGDDVTVVTTRDSADGLHTEVRNGVTVLRFTPSGAVSAAARIADRRITHGRSELVTLLRGGPASLAMFRAAAVRADVVLGTPLQFLSGYYPALRPRRQPFVLAGLLHDRGTGLSRTARWLIARADRYVALTRHEQRVVAATSAHRDFVDVVPPGIDVSRMSDGDRGVVRASLGIGDEPVIGYVGRIARPKNIATVLGAMDVVWTELPQSHLVIAGARSAYSATLQARARQSSHPDRIHFLDTFDESGKADLLAAIDVLVNVSTDESFGLVFLEAWAAGRAVVGAAIPAVSDVLRDGVDGHLVPVGDESRLASVLVAMLRDPARTEAMGHAGQARVRKMHGVDQMVSRWRAVYEAAIQQRHRSQR